MYDSGHSGVVAKDWIPAHTLMDVTFVVHRGSSEGPFLWIRNCDVTSSWMELRKDRMYVCLNIDNGPYRDNEDCFRSDRLRYDTDYNMRIVYGSDSLRLYAAEVAPPHTLVGTLTQDSAKQYLSEMQFLERKSVNGLEVVDLKLERPLCDDLPSSITESPPCIPYLPSWKTQPVILGLLGALVLSCCCNAYCLCAALCKR